MKTKNIFGLLSTFLLMALAINLYSAEPDSSKTTVKPQVFKLIKTFKRADSLSPADFSWRQDGKSKRLLSEIANKYAVIHFWVAWSEPCQKQAPDINEIVDSLNKKGVVFVSVALPKGWDSASIEAGIKEAKSFYKKYNVNHPIIFGNVEVVQAFGGMLGVPMTYLVSDKGKIVGTVFGNQEKKVYLEAVEQMLKANQ